MSVEDVFCDFKPKTKMLEYLYQNTLCSFCRESIIRTMYKQDVVPNEILYECLYDSYYDTRQFAEEKLEKRDRLA